MSNFDYPGRREFDVMICTLNALFISPPAALGVSSHAPAVEGSTAQAGLQPEQLGDAPTLTLSTGAVVRIRVEHQFRGVWIAYEHDFDLGRPLGEGATAELAVEDLRIELESELP